MKLLALMKKEFLRFFRDPKLIVSVLIPGVIIYVLYSVMGAVMWTEPERYEFKVQTVGSSPTVEALFRTAVEANEGWTVELSPAADADAAKGQIERGEIAVLVVFSENFDEEVGAYDPLSGKPAPQVEIYYNSAEETSRSCYTLLTSVLEAFESSIANKFDVNRGTGYDLSGEGGAAGAVLAGLVPFLVVALVFSSCMGVTLESVAGEKERGTLATILVTSVRRRDVALGKILPLSCIALLGALSSFVGIALSLPKVAGLSFGAFASGLGAGDYFLLLLLILSIVPLIVALVTVVSTYAKTVKEASAYTSIVMIFLMVLSLVSSFVPMLGAWSVAVPALNAVAGMQQVLSGGYALWQPLVSVLLNLVYTALLVVLVARMLASERIMFGK